MTAPASPPERVPASASPIQSDQVETIAITLSVELLAQPNERGNLRLEAPADLVPQDAFFALRYYVHGRARRAVVQALRVAAAGQGRDIATVRIFARVLEAVWTKPTGAGDEMIGAATPPATSMWPATSRIRPRSRLSATTPS